MLHSRHPQLPIPQSRAFRERLEQPPPHSDQPPNKRPRLEPKHTPAVMTATQLRVYTETNLQTLLRVNDEVAIADLEQEIERTFEWHLHADLNLPVCGEDDDDMCRVCETYVKHVNLRRGRADDDEPGSEEEALIRDNKPSHGRAKEADNDSMEGIDDDSTETTDNSTETTDDECGKSDGWNSKGMKKLFRLRDLYARRNAFDANEDDRAIGQMQGMVCTLQTEKLQADADRAHANASWAVAREELTAMQKSLDALTKAHQDLLAVHQSITDENTALKKQVESQEEFTNALTEANQELLARNQSIMEENTALKKQSACELLVHVPVGTRS